MMDANQVWDVDEAIANMAALAEVDPYWIEEPTHADDVLGHARIARAVAELTGGGAGSPPARSPPTGSSSSSCCRPSAIGDMQIDACRVGGVNEVLAELLLAAKFGVPVCPHAGGVGLCEYVQHLAIFDYLRVGRSLDGRMVEYVDHLHEHFIDPVDARDGRYRLPHRARLQRRDAAGVDRGVLLPGRPGMALTVGLPGCGHRRLRRLPAAARPLVRRACRRRHRPPRTRRVPPGPPGRLHRGGDRRGRRRLGHRRGRAPRRPTLVDGAARAGPPVQRDQPRPPTRRPTRVIGALGRHPPPAERGRRGAGAARRPGDPGGHPDRDREGVPARPGDRRAAPRRRAPGRPGRPTGDAAHRCRGCWCAGCGPGPPPAAPPIALVSCDNLPGQRRPAARPGRAGDRRRVRRLGRRFPGTMVDRIVPASTAATLDRARPRWAVATWPRSPPSRTGSG